MNRRRLSTLIMGTVLATGMVGIGANSIKINTKTQNSSNSVLLSNTNSKSKSIAVVVGNGSLVLRTSDSSGAKISSYISVGEMLTIHSKSGDYYNVTVQETGATGYISASNTKIIESGANEPLKDLHETTNIINVSNNVNLRSNPELADNVVDSLTNGTSVEVIGQQGQWYKVNVNGKVGFIYGEYIAVNSSGVGDIVAGNTNNGNNSSDTIISDGNSNNEINKLSDNDGSITIKPETKPNDGVNKPSTDNSGNNNGITNPDNGINKPSDSEGSSTIKPDTKPDDSVNKPGDIAQGGDNNSSGDTSKPGNDINNSGTTPNETPDGSTDGNHSDMKQGRLNLTVKNKATGKVLANTTVEVNGQKYKTNENGVIEGLSLWTVEQKLTIGADGFDSGTVTVTTKADSTISETVELAPVQKEAHINLKVVDVQTGKPMVNAKVIVGGSEMTTNSEGVIEGIPCWANVDQHISVTAKGYETSYLDLKPEADKTYDETVKIAPITASEIVTVVNGKTGEVLKGTNINIGGVDLKTNSNGEVKMDNLWAGKQDFTVKVNSYKDGNLSFNAVAGETGHATVKIMPKEQGRVNLTVKNKETGKVLANTVIEINGQKFTTDENGMIEGLPLWEGPQELTISSNGFNAGKITVNTNPDNIISETISLTQSK